MPVSVSNATTNNAKINICFNGSKFEYSSFAHNSYYSQCDRPIILYKTAVSGVACALQTTQDTQCPNRSLTNARILA